MALGDVLTLYRAEINGGALPWALLSGAELASDLRDDLEKHPNGALRYALRCTYAGQLILSNVDRHVWQIEITVAVHLGGGSERGYTEGAINGMLPQQQRLASRAFWLVAGVYGLDDTDGGGFAEIEPAERIVNVVRWTARARIILNA